MQQRLLREQFVAAGFARRRTDHLKRQWWSEPVALKLFTMEIRDQFGQEDRSWWLLFWNLLLLNLKMYLGDLHNILGHLDHIMLNYCMSPFLIRVLF